MDVCFGQNTCTCRLFGFPVYLVLHHSILDLGLPSIMRVVG